MAYLVRVRLPDHPGALGRLATALGDNGIDIESVAVVDRAGDDAIDDLIVGLPTGRAADAIVTAITSAGMVVEAIRPHPGRWRAYDEVALLDDAIASDDVLAVLVSGLPDLFAAGYALAVRRGTEAEVVAASLGAPECGARTGWRPPQSAGAVDPADLFGDPDAGGPDCALIAAPIDGEHTLVVGRNGGAEFRPSELLRLAHLSSLLNVALTARIHHD